MGWMCVRLSARSWCLSRCEDVLFHTYARGVGCARVCDSDHAASCVWCSSAKYDE